MNRKRMADFFAELDLHEQLTSQFFRDIEEARKQEAIAKEKEERYWVRRRRNMRRAFGIKRWIIKVESIDLFKMTQHVEPDFFGNKRAQFAAVKRLHERKGRILWVLRNLYHYLMFDKHLVKQTQKKKLTYSAYRRVYYKLEEQHYENLKQARWDEKRAKVRARRGKEKGVVPDSKTRNRILVQMLRMRYGTGGHVPIIDNKGLQDTIWD